MNVRGLCLVVVGVSMTSCSSSTRECNVGADCASGACRSDGTCVPMPATDGGAPTTDASADHVAEASADSLSEDAAAPVGDSATCMPNGDDIVTREEVYFAAGLHATFCVALSTPVDTAGKVQPDGSRQWDLSGALQGDHDVLVDTLDPTAAWYAQTFPTATYAAQLSDTQALLGVFEATESSLVLQGVVSPASGSMQTSLTYNPVVTTLEFPLQQGGSWMTSAQVTGTAQGVPAAYSEAYASSVDARGTMITPYATFRVLRVAVVLTRTVGVVVTTVRTFLFVADCFGTVASITSNDNEQQAEFTTAAEARRLAP